MQAQAGNRHAPAEADFHIRSRVPWPIGITRRVTLALGGPLVTDAKRAARGRAGDHFWQWVLARRQVRQVDVPEFAVGQRFAGAAAEDDAQRVWKDAYGTELQDGDTVTLIKDLKVKGSSSVVKVGTKVKNIRLVDGDHDIDCKIDGFGAMGLKSEFVKKA